MKHVRKSETQRPRARFLILAAVLAVLIAGSVFALRSMIKPANQLEATMLPKQTAEPEVLQETPVVIPPKPVKKPTVTKKESKVDKKTGEEVEVETEVPASHRDGIYNILVCGTDYDGSHTDTIMIAHLDANEHTTALMSVPRDTVVDGWNGGIMKINAVYAGGGEDGMKRLQSRLETLLGFPTDGYVLIELEAFQKVVDIMGGVWYDVPMDMHYTDASQDLFIDLKAGYQKLNGYDAMCLCRFRKGYPSQDIQRTQVQQDFVKTVAKQCMSLKNLTKLKEFAEVFKEDVLTDLSLGNLLYFAVELAGCDLDEMISHTVQGQGVMVNGISYYPLYDWSILEIVNEAFNPYEVPLTLDNIRVITPNVALTYQTPPEPEPEPEPETVPEPEGEGETELWPEDGGEPTQWEDEQTEPWDTDSPEWDALWDTEGR